jgi:hypothetical protein
MYTAHTQNQNKLEIQISQQNQLYIKKEFGV